MKIKGPERWRPSLIAHMLHTPIAKISALLTAAICVWALVKGRWPERVGALAVAVDWIGGTLFQDHRPFHHGQPVMFAMDVLQALVMLGLAAGCRRAWVLWGAAAASLLALTHVIFMLDTRFGQWSYLTVSYLWTLGVLAALGAGVAFEASRPATTAAWVQGLLGVRAARPSIPSARARRRS